jgi:hypothetical protein
MGWGGGEGRGKGWRGIGIERKGIGMEGKCATLVAEQASDMLHESI